MPVQDRRRAGGDGLLVIRPEHLAGFGIHEEYRPARASGAKCRVGRGFVFLVFVTFIAIRMLFGGERWKLGDQLPGRGMLAIYGLITGLFSSLVGVSGGAISNAVLTLYGRPMHQAVGTSAGVGVPITIAGTIGYMLAGWPHMAQLPPLSVGYVSLVGLVLMAPVSSYTTSYGVRLAHWLPRRKLEIAFGVFLILVALRFAASMI